MQRQDTHRHSRREGEVVKITLSFHCALRTLGWKVAETTATAPDINEAQATQAAA